MADDKPPTQAEIDAEEAKAKGKFQEWFTESMTSWQTAQDKKAADEAKRNPPKADPPAGGASSGPPRRVNALQRLLNL